MSRILTAFTLVLAVAAWASAQPPAEQKTPENVNKAKEVVSAHLAKINGKNATIVWINDDSLTKTFPKHVFLAVRFRIYPVAMQMPEGMKPSNIFAVKDGKFEQVKDAKALEAFFKANATVPEKKQAQIDAARSWLWLSQEFVQDGFYKFEILDKEIKVDLAASLESFIRARAIVKDGGNGEIAILMRVQPEGKIASVTDNTKVKPGPRPICQATKLLDPDPVVRKMAEADLLYMGLAARDYIMEQRATASPELRDAIDRVWEKIVKNGW
ncbi:MAG TPA: hypothetical protein VE988_25690 [Gemmataceae bacterium]|nr:hypothetical protein [Gemmataceae bacterium]